MRIVHSTRFGFKIQSPFSHRFFEIASGNSSLKSFGRVVSLKEKMLADLPLFSSSKNMTSADGRNDFSLKNHPFGDPSMATSSRKCPLRDAILNISFMMNSIQNNSILI